MTDDQSASATVTIRVKTRAGAVKKTMARDLSGNRAQTPLGHNRLTVK